MRRCFGIRTGFCPDPRVEVDLGPFRCQRFAAPGAGQQHDQDRGGGNSLRVRSQRIVQPADLARAQETLAAFLGGLGDVRARIVGAHAALDRQGEENAHEGDDPVRLVGMLDGDLAVHGRDVFAGYCCNFALAKPRNDVPRDDAAVFSLRAQAAARQVVALKNAAEIANARRFLLVLPLLPRIEAAIDLPPQPCCHRPDFFGWPCLDVANREQALDTLRPVSQHPRPRARSAVTRAAKPRAQDRLARGGEVRLLRTSCCRRSARGVPAPAG